MCLLPLEDGRLEASAELIIITSEPTYSPSGDCVAKDRQLDTFRANASIRTISGVIEALTDLRREMETLERGYTRVAAAEKTVVLDYFVSKNTFGKFELWSSASPSKHYGLGVFASVEEAERDLRSRHPGWRVEGPFEHDGADCVKFIVTPK